MKGCLLIDRDYLRIPTKNKAPIRKDWSIPVNRYYKETLTIIQLLKEYGEYGIRLGLFIKKDYHLGVLYFRTSEITQWTKKFSNFSYVLTENGFYYFVLLKELPPNGLLKDLNGKTIGNFYGGGKLVIGPGSKINGFTYQFVQRNQDYLTFDFLKDLLNYLLNFNLGLEIKGQVKFNAQQNEWLCPIKLDQRWKRRNFAKAKLSKEIKLTKCLDCSRRIKETNLVKHLTKIHQRKFNPRKIARSCRKCQEKYSTVIKKKEHCQFYCSKNKFL